MSQIIPRNTLLGLSAEILQEIANKACLKECWGLITSCRWIYQALFEEKIKEAVSSACFTPETIHILGKKNPRLARYVHSINLPDPYLSFKKNNMNRLPKKMQKILYCFLPFNAQDKKRIFRTAGKVFEKIKDEKVFFLCTALEKIILPQFCTDKDIDIIVQNFHFLKVVDLQSSQITDIGLETLAKRCPDLRIINLTRCGDMTQAAGKPLVSEEGIKAVADHCPNLEVLILEQFPRSITKIAIYFLENCYYLRRMNLGYASVDQELFNVLLENKYALKTLNLRGYERYSILLDRNVFDKLLKKGIKVDLRKRDGFEEV